MWSRWKDFHNDVHKPLDLSSKSDNLVIVIISIEYFLGCGKKPRLVLILFVINDDKCFMKETLIAIFPVVPARCLILSQQPRPINEK